MVELEWAYDKNLKLVNIKDFTKLEKSELMPFYCRLCFEEEDERKEVIARKGNIRQHHFALKNHLHAPETIAHSNAKDDMYRLLKNYLEKNEPFYAGINLDDGLNSQSINIKRKIQRINILRNISDVIKEKGLENGRRPDISLLNKDGRVIRAIEIVVSNAPDDNKIKDLTDFGIELIILKIEPPDWIKSKLKPEYDIKFEVSINEIHNPSVPICKKQIRDDEFCIDDTQERLHCIIPSYSKDIIFDFEKCLRYRGQNERMCSYDILGKKCNRMLLEMEKDYCKDCAKNNRQKDEKEEQIIDLNAEAQRLFEKMLYREAIVKWKMVLILEPDNKIADEGIKRAIDGIKKEIEKETKNQIIKLNSEALKLFEKKLWADAIARWREVLSLDPQNKTAIDGINNAEEEKSKLEKERIEKKMLEKAGFIPAIEIIKAPDNIIKIKDLNLPPSVIDFYLDSGITDLYQPQAEAIKKGLLESKNIVAAIPTASGKTLLAEFAMLKSILDENKRGKALYIVPLRALASEKYDRFRSFEMIKKSNGRGILTGIATGDFDASGDWLGNFDIIVATSEKVDSLLRNKTRWLEEITVVIADEIHLIDSSDRGPTLEIVLAKLRRINPDMQIIALSATIGNANEIAKWLDANLVVSNWRPTELKEGVFFGNAITFANRSQRAIEEFHKDGAISLVADTIKEGGQCLIFENSRKSSEGMAARVGISISKLISGEVKEKLKNLAAEINETSEVESTKKLAMCVENGSAFHHAGLISEQRKIVEGGFRAGIIKVISSTPTLAAGLNLPARRVIIKGYWRYDVNYGQTPIPVLEYKQMAGRAGRPRLDPYGESVLVAKTFDDLEELMKHYVLADVEKIWSKLGSENALRTHILSTIATGFAQSMEELLEFMRATFYSTQQEPWGLKAVIEKVIDFLVEKKFIKKENGLYATRLGELVSRLYIDPLSASMILEGMEKIEEKGIRFTDLTLLHLACRTPDMRQLYLRSNDYEWLSDLVMEHHAEFVQIPAQFKVDYEWFLSEVKTACVMLDWINEKKEEDIVKKFGIGEGDIRALSETALWLVHSMAELGRHEKRSCGSAAVELEKRVEYGASPELLDLIQIRGIGRVRARKLFNSGIRDMQTLRVSDLQTVSKIIGPKVALKILKQIGTSVIVEERTEEQRSLGDFS